MKTKSNWNHLVGNNGTKVQAGVYGDDHNLIIIKYVTVFLCCAADEILRFCFPAKHLENYSYKHIIVVCRQPLSIRASNQFNFIKF
jgi:hypothetical protein